MLIMAICMFPKRDNNYNKAYVIYTKIVFNDCHQHLKTNHVQTFGMPNKTNPWAHEKQTQLTPNVQNTLKFKTCTPHHN